MQSSSLFHLVHPSEVAEFFERIGLRQEFIEGQIKCHYCRDPLTSHNFKVVTRRKDQLLFVCDKPQCYTAFLDVSSRD